MSSDPHIRRRMSAMLEAAAVPRCLVAWCRGGTAGYRNVKHAILGELFTRVSGVPYVELVESELPRSLGGDAVFAYAHEMCELVRTF